MSNIYTYMKYLSKYNWKALLEDAIIDEVFPLKSLEYQWPSFDCNLENYIATPMNQHVMETYYDNLIKAGFIKEENIEVINNVSYSQ